MELPSGRITRLLSLPDPEGAWHLAAAVATDDGREAVGFLVAPPNGARGQVGFEPIEGLTVAPGAAVDFIPGEGEDAVDFRPGEGDVELPPREDGAEGSGTMTTADVPTRTD